LRSLAVKPAACLTIDSIVTIHTPGWRRCLEDLLAKEALVADELAIFTTPHFDGYPAVLIELDEIDAEVPEDLNVEAWLCRAPKRLAQEYAATHALG
jgi:hypothetical protein